LFLCKTDNNENVLLAYPVYNHLYHCKEPATGTEYFIITLDGFRWQEYSNGADPGLLSNPQYAKDTSLLQQMYGGATTTIRRQKLLPFFWNVIANQGNSMATVHWATK